MKNRILRTVCGVMLSAMLMITVAIPALADCAKDGHNIENGTVTTTYINADQNNHQIRTEIKGKCTVCGEKITVVDTSTKPHTPDANGKCTACGYQVWHRP